MGSVEIPSENRSFGKEHFLEEMYRRWFSFGGGEGMGSEIGPDIN